MLVAKYLLARIILFGLYSTARTNSMVRSSLYFLVHFSIVIHQHSCLSCCHIKMLENNNHIIRARIYFCIPFLFLLNSYMVCVPLASDDACFMIKGVLSV